MFNIYDNILTKDASRSVTIDELVDLIKTRPPYESHLGIGRMFNDYTRQWTLEELESADDEKKSTYSKIKSTYNNIKVNQIPVFIPNVYSELGFKTKKYLTKSTGFIYLDVDKFIDKDELEKYKSYYILKHRCIYAMWESMSGYGLSILVKVEDYPIDQYGFYYDALNEVFENKLDTQAKGIVQPCILNFDPEIYVNKNCVAFSVDESKKGIITPYTSLFLKVSTGDTFFKKDDDRITKLESLLLTQSKYNTKNIDNWKSELSFRTYLDESYFTDVNKPYISLEGIEVIEINLYPNLHIKEGKRHNFISAILTQLLYLNQQAKRESLFNTISYINRFYCYPSIPKDELISTFNKMYERFIKGKLDINRFKKVKYVHWSYGCTLPRDKKFKLANKQLGQSRSELTLQVIYTAIEDLQDGQKITQKRIKEYVGKSVVTIKRYYKKHPELKDLVKYYNDDLKQGNPN